MRGATAVRFAIEAAFLVGVAVLLGSLNQRWPVILPAMAAALAVTYASEWTASRIRRGGKPSARDELPAGGFEGRQFAVPEPSAPVGAVMPERPLESPLGHAEPSPVTERVAEVGPAAPEPAAPTPIESTDGERRRLFRPRPRPLPPEPDPAAERVAAESETPVRLGPAPQPPPVPAPAAAEEAGVPPEQPPGIAPEPPAAESEPAPAPEVAPESEPE